MHSTPFLRALLAVSLIITGSAPAQTPKKPATGKPAPASVGNTKAAATPAAWKSSTRHLTATTTIEVRFAQPMVAQSAVGTQPAEAPGTITPPLKGSWTWRSQQSAVFVPGEAPKKATQYAFALREDLATLSGERLPATPVFSITAPALSLVHRFPTWFPPKNVPREPQLILQFDENMDVGAAAKAIYFRDKAGSKVAAQVRAATMGDLRSNPQMPDVMRQSALASLGASVDQTKVKLETLVPAMVVAEPAEPLPVGEEWKLVVDAGLPSADGKSKTAEVGLVNLGDVPPLLVESCNPTNTLDQPKELRISLNKPLSDEVTPEKVQKLLGIRPAPQDLKVSLNESVITVHGDFAVYQPYAVKLGPGLKAADDLVMERGFSDSVTFELIEPVIAVPAFSANQLIQGRGVFDVQAVNMSNVTVRVKAADRDSLIYALRAYRSYTTPPEGTTREDDEAGFFRIPFDSMPGRKIFEKKFTAAASADALEKLEVHWKDALADKISGALFVTVEAEARPEWHGKKKRFGAQAFVQLTDLGLAWKVTSDEAFIQVFSESTGEPLKGVKLTAFDEENRPLTTVESGVDGCARLARKEAAWLMAELADDLHAVSIGDDIELLGMWRMGVHYDWEPSEKDERQVVIFTDRPVYLPAETVFFKAITRMLGPDGVKVPGGADKAVLRAFDSRGKLFAERDVTLSATGALDGAVDLPSGSLGQHRIELAFARADAANAQDSPENESEGEERDPEVFSHYFLVEEYRPNTFSIAFDNTAFNLDGEKAVLPLRARYLLGKPLSKAKMSWTAQVSRAPFDSEAFPSYRFLDSRQTYYWDEEGYHDVPDREDEEGDLTGQGKGDLSDAGESALEFTVPAQPDSRFPREVTVSAEVTDLNQQTITERWSRTLHSSDFYLGIRELESVTGTEEPVLIEVAAANNQGLPWPQPVDTKLSIEKVTFNSVRVQTAGGGSNVRTDAERKVVAEGHLKVMPKGQVSEGLSWQPKEPGFYYITTRATDPQGRAVEAMASLQVYGTGWATWEEKDGVKIDLAADKEEYQPGETAKILIKCPIAGRALVCVERRSVIKHFLADIRGNAQAIDVPIDESMAPNVFVSVFVTRGAQDSPRQHKRPDYKVGFCQLKVKDVRSRLQIAVSTGRPEYRPGDEGEAAVMVTDSRGQPVAGAEVTFWAVDQGILSLMEYETPDPWTQFHQPVALAVQTGTSLMALLPEDPSELAFTNKGYAIGGGGAEAIAEKLRKNFRPLAFWQAALTSGADGRVALKFTVPDNLTEFRVIAVASKDADRFGTGEAGFKINKPLMLEPALPRFANVGDQITAKGIILNNTDKAFEVEVALKLDATATSAQELTKRVSVTAHETRAVGFPLVFAHPGTAKWQWAAKSLTAGIALADSVESTLDVGLAEPWLRDVQFAAVSAATSGQNLLAAINPELLEGRGEITLTLSNSSLAEAASAIVHLLHYPYGCVEQTSSSTIPWLALHQAGDALPGVKQDPARVKKAIQAGASRLLSMQTANGGLAYWPGGQSPELWASAYGGMCLAMCQKNGAAVPPPRLDELAAYLSGQLRNSAAVIEPWELFQRAHVCYTLALLGKSEPAYHDVLAGKAAGLPHAGRALLALAMLESGGNPDEAQKVLDAPLEPQLEQWSGNIFDSRLTAMNLLVWARLDPKNVVTVKLTERLLKERTARGDWGSTYENAWALLALAAETTANGKDLRAANVMLSFAEAQRDIAFPAKPATQTVTLSFSGALTERELKLQAAEGTFLRAAIDVKSRSRHAPQQARSNGFTIARRYEKVASDGQVGPAENLEVGDLIAVTLDIDIPQRVQYLAVDDALPAIFEAMNSKFKSQASATPVVAADANRALAWWSSFEELRKDRALFFADEIWTPGKYEIRYLARVAAEGNATAPPAKIEAMYDPDRYGLSGSELISARLGDGKVAGK
ncbi:MAG: alpha-2-macroglobulin family protein [Verrucomicrobiales bacterium]